MKIFESHLTKCPIHNAHNVFQHALREVSICGSLIRAVFQRAVCYIIIKNTKKRPPNFHDEAVQCLLMA